MNTYGGYRLLTKIAEALEKIQVGIICLTPENLAAEWIHYETGALSSKTSAHVCTYLLGDLRTGEVPPPLGEF